MKWVFINPKFCGALIHHTLRIYLSSASDMPGHRLTGIVRTCHQHSGNEIAQEKFFARP